MTPEEVLAALGIAWERCPPPPTRDDLLGSSPSDDASLRFDGEAAVVLVHDPLSWEAAMHEAIHAMMGPASLDDEHALMAVEYAVCSELCEPWLSEWRESFARYGLSWEIEGVSFYVLGRAANLPPLGSTDVFTRSTAWARCVAEAEALGFLHDGRVVWGLGSSPAWSSYVEEA